MNRGASTAEETDDARIESNGARAGAARGIQNGKSLIHIHRHRFLQIHVRASLQRGDGG